MPDSPTSLSGETQVTPPAFIVGVPRSGTTLLAAMLSSHRRLSCGPETNFFIQLSFGEEAPLVDPRTWPQPALAFLFAVEHSGAPIPDNFGVTRAEAEAYLREQPPSIAAILSTLTALYMRRSGKARWIEKTAGHLPYAADIRRHFPRSPIIRIVRDPRDVALSLLNVPWGPKTFLGGITFWREQDERGTAFFQTDANVYTVRFEDLLAAPEEELRRICAFLGEEFEPAMLDTKEAAGHVNKTREAWKDKVAGSVDPSRAAVWQRTLTEEQKHLAEALIGDRLQAYGYPHQHSFERYVSAFPITALEEYAELVDRLVAARIRFWPDKEGQQPVRKLYIGHPDADGWLGVKRAERGAQTWQIVKDVLRARLAGPPIAWLDDPADAPMTGLCAWVLKRVLPAPLTAQALLDILVTSA